MYYENAYVFGGIYASKDAARRDYANLVRAYDDGVIGPYQAAMVQKHPSGRVEVLDTESTTREAGAAAGAVVGATLGLLFPPAIPLTTVQGAAIGAAEGDIDKGWTTGDVKRLAADELMPGETGIIAVAEAGPMLDEAALLADARLTKAELVAAEDTATIRDALESDRTVVVS